MDDMLRSEFDSEFNAALAEQVRTRLIDWKAEAFMEHLNRSVGQKCRRLMEEVKQRVAVYCLEIEGF